MDRRATPGNLAGALAAAAVFLVAGAVTLAFPPSPDERAGCPKAALAAMRDLHIEGPVLNSEPVGGCLIFNGIPPFIDGRIEMYGDAFLGRWWQASVGHVATLKALLAQYHIGWTLFERTSGAAQSLDLLPGWRRAYADDYFVIHVRDDSAAPLAK